MSAITYEPKYIVLCGKDPSGNVVPMKSANTNSLPAITFIPEYYVACVKDALGDIVPVSVDEDGNPQ
jgi:hypothetical protein